MDCASLRVYLLLFFTLFLFPPTDCLRQQILDLSVDGTEFLFGPAVELGVQAGREPQRDLLLLRFLLRHGFTSSPLSISELL